jgi:hypothetical protein
MRTGDRSSRSSVRILVAFRFKFVTNWVFMKVILKYHWGPGKLKLCSVVLRPNSAYCTLGTQKLNLPGFRGSAINRPAKAARFRLVLVGLAVAVAIAAADLYKLLVRRKPPTSFQVMSIERLTQVGNLQGTRSFHFFP